MYLDFYRFNKKPFESIPDPDFFYESPVHREALAAINYAVENNKGIIVVSGEVGTGKTTLARYYLNTLPSDIVGLYMNYPFDSLLELMKFLAVNIGLNPNELANTVIELSQQVGDHLFKLHEEGVKIVLVIDESQNLSFESLEYIRLLSNFHVGNKRLINIVLIGQNELLDKLNSKELRQLKQRIAIQIELTPFNFEQTVNYIKHRILLAGSYENPFTNMALKLIYRKSKGIPRLINIICDNALLMGYAQNKRKISAWLVIKSLKEGEHFAVSFLDIRWIHIFLVAVVIFMVFLGLKARNYYWNGKASGNKVSSGESPSSHFLADVKSFLSEVEAQSEVSRELSSYEKLLNENRKKNSNLKINHDEQKIKDSGNKDRDVKQNHDVAIAQSNEKERILYVPRYDEASLRSSSESPVKAKPRDYLLKIIKKTYGVANDTLLDIVQVANPDIKNINLIKVGQNIVLPRISIDTLILKDSEGHYFLHYFSSYSKEKAYRKLMKLKNLPYPMALHTINFGNKKVYRIYIGPFNSRKELVDAFKVLPKDHLAFLK